MAISKIVNSNVMCCIIRGYEVIILNIRSEDSERDTITVLKNSINNVGPHTLPTILRLSTRGRLVPR